MRDVKAQQQYNSVWRQDRRMRGIRYVHGKGFKKIEPCEVCGEGDIDLIDAHHIVPRQHNFGENHSREASEYIYLCSNCHRKLHKIFGGMGSIPYTGPLAKYEIIRKVKVARKLRYEARSVDAKTCNQIREDYRNKLGSIRYLAAKYMLNRSTIANIISGKYLPKVLPPNRIKLSKIKIVQEDIPKKVEKLKPTLPPTYINIRDLYFNKGKTVNDLSVMYGMTGLKIRGILKIRLKIMK